MKRILMVAAVALMMLSACGSKDQVKKPTVLLSEQQMIDVLTDSYLIEAELNRRKSVGEHVDTLQVAYYRQLFEHYGITDSLFEANMVYYTYQLPVLERIMDSVNTRLVKAQENQ